MSGSEHPFSEIFDWYLHRCQKTLTELNNNILSDPQNAMYYYKRGMIHYNNKKYNSALQDWLLAYELGGMQFYRLKFWIRAIREKINSPDNENTLPPHFPVFST